MEDNLLAENGLSTLNDHSTMNHLPAVDDTHASDNSHTLDESLNISIHNGSPVSDDAPAFEVVQVNLSNLASSTPYVIGSYMMPWNRMVDSPDSHRMNRSPTLNGSPALSDPSAVNYFNVPDILPHIMACEEICSCLMLWEVISRHRMLWKAFFPLRTIWLA